MTAPISLGAIIATRTLAAIDSRLSVIVSIGMPRPYPDGRDFFCPFRIDGLGDDRVKHAGGVDAVQALQLAMQRIGVELYSSPHAPTLRWLDATNPDLGFPVPDAISDLIPKHPAD